MSGRRGRPRVSGAVIRAVRDARLAEAVKRFYGALSAARARKVLVASIDVTGFSEDNLANLRGALESACYPRDKHYPARRVAFSIRSVP